MGDLKFFLFIGVVGVVAYGLLFPWNWSRYPWVHRPPPAGNGYIIVPKNYPGAKLMPIEHKR